MNILFSADWHLKLGVKNIPNDWAKNRYRTLFKEIHKLTKEVDLHVLGGDVFDKLPTMEELELFFEYVAECNVKTIIFAGNHEALKKDTTFLTNLKIVVNKINSLVEIIDDYYTMNENGKAAFDIIPYNNLKAFAKKPVELSSRLLFTHVRGEIPPHVKPEVDLSIFERWDLVLAGDLHSHSNSQLNIVYPGSPVTTSFHRNFVKTGVISINTDNLEWDWIELKVPQLIRKTIDVDETPEKDEYHHIVYEVEGSLTDLQNVELSELVDRKISTRVVDTALILDKEMSIQEEVKEYLLYILELSEEESERVLAELNDNIAKINMG